MAQQPKPQLEDVPVASDVSYLNCLSRFIVQWSSICEDSWVLSIIADGYRLEFYSAPQLLSESLCKDNLLPELDVRIRELLSKGRAEIVPDGFNLSGFYSRFFAIDKKDGGCRPILDLCLLNKHLFISTFRMVTISTVLEYLSVNLWFAVLI